MCDKNVWSTHIFFSLFIQRISLECACDEGNFIVYIICLFFRLFYFFFFNEKRAFVTFHVSLSLRTGVDWLMVMSAKSKGKIFLYMCSPLCLVYSTNTYIVYEIIRRNSWYWISTKSVKRHITFEVIAFAHNCADNKICMYKTIVNELRWRVGIFHRSAQPQQRRFGVKQK